MTDIGYTNFSSDCENTFERFLRQFGFSKQSENTDEFEVIYESIFWKIEISMLSNFPHVGVTFELKSKENKAVKTSILAKALAIDSKEVQEIYKEYFTAEHFRKSPKEQYRIEMEYCVVKLAKFYKSLLIGDFTFKDYEKFASLT